MKICQRSGITAAAALGTSSVAGGWIMIDEMGMSPSAPTGIVGLLTRSQGNLEVHCHSPRSEMGVETKTKGVLGLQLPVP